jgi:hypothetical protein
MALKLLNMRRKSIGCIIILTVIVLWSCGRNNSTNDTKDSENRVVQQDNGIVSLTLAKAGCYCDKVNPSNNTADWNFVISKPGRFKVWLSSATKDTSDLRYANSVRISLLDNHLEVNPACDKIIQNAEEVQYPYFRADSYVGSVYVSEPGEYNIQVISDKVVEGSAGAQGSVQANDTRLMSVILTPATR